MSVYGLNWLFAEQTECECEECGWFGEEHGAEASISDLSEFTCGDDCYDYYCPVCGSKVK